MWRFAANYCVVFLGWLVSFGCGQTTDPATSSAPTGGALTGAAATGAAATGTPATGAASTGAASTAGPAQYCDPLPILQASCSGVACHGFLGMPARFNTDLLNAPAGQTLGQSLIGKPANYGLVVDPTDCPTDNPELLINPSAPAESLILKKITGTQTCGVRMPNEADGATLPQSDVDCFVSWVNGVITENGGTVTSGAAVTNTATSSGATSSTATTGTSSGSGGASSTSATASTTGLGVIPPADFNTVVDVFTTNVINCTGADCHAGHVDRLDLRPDVPGVPPLYERITTWRSELCNKLVVSPFDPDQSALLQVLTTGCGNVTPDCLIGTECIPRMPLGCVDGEGCIPPEYVEAIRQWIANGAPP